MGPGRSMGEAGVVAVVVVGGGGLVVTGIPTLSPGSRGLAEGVLGAVALNSREESPQTPSLWTQNNNNNNNSLAPAKRNARPSCTAWERPFPDSWSLLE